MLGPAAQLGGGPLQPLNEATRPGVPLTTIKKWLGHADLKTTAIEDARGEAEKAIRDLAVEMGSISVKSA